MTTPTNPIITADHLYIPTLSPKKKIDKMTIKKVEENEKQSYLVQRRCLCAASKLKKGHLITEDDLLPLRPIGTNSFQPFEKDLLIGKKLKKDIQFGENFTKNILL